MAASSLTSGPQPAPNARGQGLLFQGAKPYAAGVAGVAELVDALDLGSSAARRGGSSPLLGTTYPRKPHSLDGVRLSGFQTSGVPARSAAWPGSIPLPPAPAQIVLPLA